MDVQAILNAVSTVGFPIVACCGLFWFCNKLIDKITTVISDNTEAINKLIQKLEGDN